MRFQVSYDLPTRGEHLKPPKSQKTAHFVDQIVDRSLVLFSWDPEVNLFASATETKSILLLNAKDSAARDLGKMFSDLEFSLRNGNLAKEDRGR